MSADDLDRMVAEATSRIEQEHVPGHFGIPDIAAAARRAGFGEAPESVTVSYMAARVDLSERDEDW